MARRPFWLALAVSLLLHAGFLTVPGWGLPDLAGELQPARLDTRLLPVIPAAKPAAEPPPAAPQRKPLVPKPEAPVAQPPDEPSAPPPPVLAEPEPQPPEEAIPAPATVPPAPTFADVWPRAGRLFFKITRGDGLWVGNAEHRWQHDGERYQLRAITETTGLAALFHSAKVMQESSGLLLPTGLQPLEFRVVRDGKLREAARIDPAQNTVTLGHGQSVQINGPVQDVLTLFYQHGAMPDNVTSYSVMIATGRRVGEYHVSVEGKEKLETPWGERSVRRLRMYTQTKNDSSEIWLDEITRLPFKIRYRDGKGDVYDQIIDTVELGQSK